MSVFCDKEIRAAVASGQIVITPYRDSRIKSSSVDVSLGQWFYSTERDPHQGILNPYDPTSHKAYYKGPIEALTHEEWLDCWNLRHPFGKIPLDTRLICLRPGERILAHTEEYIGIRYGGTTMMHAKSTTGRYGISVCDDAGWGDEGYVNRWTLEVRNKNSRAIVPLVVGAPISQLIFFHMETAECSYDGHYQDDITIEQMMRQWSPTMMLPRTLSVGEAL